MANCGFGCLTGGVGIIRGCNDANCEDAAEARKAEEDGGAAAASTVGGGGSGIGKGRTGLYCSGKLGTATPRIICCDG